MDSEKPIPEEPDPQKMFKRLQRMQFMSLELQAKMEDMEVEGDSGDGLVKVVMNCAGKVLNLDMHESVKGWDNEIVGNLVMTALNNAIDAKEEAIRVETMRMAKERNLDDDKFE